ncbi:MAG: glycosyltransferase family 4 protein [Vulcanimicrobiaceae bacterium]
MCDIAGAEGGSEAFLNRAIPALVKTGLSVSVLARTVRSGNYFADVPIREVAWGTEDEPASEDAARDVRDAIARGAPDVVMTSNVFDTLVLREVRRAERFVVRLHDHRATCPNGDRLFKQFAAPCDLPMGTACAVNSLLRGCVCGPRPETLRRVRAREDTWEALRAADAIVVSSHYMAGLCATNGAAPARTFVVPPPVDPGAFVAVPAPAPPRPRLLFAGRIVPQKGLRSLVRATALVPERLRPAVRVAGAPTAELDAARAIADRSGVRLEHLGWLDQKGLWQAMDDVHAMAVPSLWPEPFGLVGIEAQARGRPSVGYAVGGIPEWMGDAGRSVPVRNAGALAEAIVEVTAESTWPSLCEAAIRRAASFRPDDYARKLREILCASS